MTDGPPPGNPDDIVVECELQHSPDQVWAALTDPELVAAWLGPTDIKPQAGARFTIKAESPGSDAVECEVLQAEAPNLIRYKWRADGIDSVVSFELTETSAGGTHLRLVHGDFARSNLLAISTRFAPRAALPPLRPRRRSALTSCAARPAGAYRPLRAAA